LFPEGVGFKDLDLFAKRLSQRGSEALLWDEWKYVYRKDRFQRYLHGFRFFGLTNEDDRLSAIGRKYVLSGEKERLIVGFVQSDYYPLLLRLNSGFLTSEQLLVQLSDQAGIIPEKNRKAMLTSFVDIGEGLGLIKASKGKVSLTTAGREKVAAHTRIPLWVHELPEFAEARRVEAYKALIYETGHPLRDITAKAFEELGFVANVIPSDIPGVPDVELMLNDFHAVVETKGEIKQIGENDVNQLSKASVRSEYAGRHMILVGNPYRLKPIELRGEPFHKDGVTLALAKGITLMTSVNLLRIVESKWRHEFDITEFRRKVSVPGLFSSRG